MRTNPNHLWAHIQWLASEPRPAESDRLELCRQYCESHLSGFGWNVTRRPFHSQDADLQSWHGVNLIGTHSQNPTHDDRPVFVLGAHLDSRTDTPGADDNASAVAVLLEVARCISESGTSNHTVALELLLFDLEELGMLGGACHADDAASDGRNILGMVSLEMLGYRDTNPGSQQLPQQLQGRYPNTADFIAVIGNQDSGSLINSFSAGMKQIDGLPVESLQVPDNGFALPQTRLSDHSPFWDRGYPALMVTDTSFMRNPHYHTQSDTIETLDRDFLHQVADGVLASVQIVCES